MKTWTHLLLAAVALSACVGCASYTRNYGTVTADGRIYERVVCGAKTPGKCLLRAREVCGVYSVVEPIHTLSDDSRQVTMAVQCIGSY